jgi:uncharacterized protein
MILLDVGVWLAAIWGRHLDHEDARAWFNEQNRPVALCRVTQMSLLRLLSNPAIMRDDALTRAECWTTMDRLMSDDRVRLVGEPDHLDLAWRSLSARDDHSHKLWTDDYLGAFAMAAGITVATLDKAFAARHPAVAVELVGSRTP